MQAPQRSSSKSQVAPSDHSKRQDSTSPRTANTQRLGAGVWASSNSSTRQDLHYGSDAPVAYAANPTSDTTFQNLVTPFNSTRSIASRNTSATGPSSLADTSANAGGVPNVNLASFGSQPWPTTTAPYLDFAPQPIYEPTGELLHEAVESFEQFDDLSSFRQPSWPPDQEKIATTSHVDNKPTGTLTHLQDLHRDLQNVPKSALKRPLDTETDADEQPQRENRQQHSDPRKARRVSFEQMSGTGPASADDEDSSSSEDQNLGIQVGRTAAQPGRGRGRGRGRGAGALPTPRSAVPQPTSGNLTSALSGRGNRTPSAHSNSILAPEKVFPIQIGSELFRLSGASISSDAPSYFTQFFEEQIRQTDESSGVRTLIIDRDPETFRDVARHLQGYYVKPRDGSHFVKLFADAQFYSLPRLIDQLFESEIFIQIGEKHFQIPKDIFSDPGNSPNFFSLGFAVFFSTPDEVFPGLDRRGLLRPPSITPPYVPNRSAETFAQLLHLLRGYPLHIRDEDHRAELLRDCRYFHLRGLEQKIIAHEISYNLARDQKEICLRIEDIKPSGISFKADTSESEEASESGWIQYARPFVDDESYALIVEIGGESTTLSLNDMRADFHGLSRARVSSLFQVIANKMNLPTNAPFGAMMLSGSVQASRNSPGHTPLSEDRVKVRFEPASHIRLDGQDYSIDWNTPLGDCMATGPKAQQQDSDDPDAMQEDRPSHPPFPKQSPGRGFQQAAASGSKTAQQEIYRPSHLEGTNISATRKRRRQTISSSEASTHGEWILRSAQWRLRVQPNEQDAIRGGHEIVFYAVKVDAYSQERARNARRTFLGR